jgi:pimeloyl-ACP methyl ester carboxylesterase
MAELAFTRRGAGAPLVLLHPIGLSRRAWDPVLPALAQRFDVVAVDLPGHGESELLPGEPTPAAVAASVASFLDSLGITTPHVAGNSFGGWVALELAGMRPVASLALLSPAGLWPGRTPLYNRISLRSTHWLTRRAGGLLSRLVASRLGRVLILTQTHGRPGRVDPEYARMEIRVFGTSVGFDATMTAARDRNYRAGSSLGAPVTVAFGSRDRILLRASRHVEQLPPGTQVMSLPGLGHVPMPEDPDAVVAFISKAVTAPVPPAG